MEELYFLLKAFPTPKLFYIYGYDPLGVFYVYAKLPPLPSLSGVAKRLDFPELTLLYYGLVAAPD